MRVRKVERAVRLDLVVVRELLFTDDDDLEQIPGPDLRVDDRIRKVVRRRIEVQEKIKTLTAEGRMQAAVLLLLPPLLLAIISLLNKDYVSKLWDSQKIGREQV